MRFDLETWRAWADYMRRNRKANEDYQTHPEPAPEHIRTTCHGCGKPTQSKYGTCAKCVGRKDR